MSVSAVPCVCGDAGVTASVVVVGVGVETIGYTWVQVFAALFTRMSAETYPAVSVRPGFDVRTRSW